MNHRADIPRRLAVLVLACVLAAPVSAAKQALLIGVGDYRADYPGLDLEGPPHDVAAMREALIDAWGFKADQVQTLVDGQATRRAILAAIDDLQRRTRAGDFVLLYYSGHGTSLHDPKLGRTLALPDDTGALLPWDFGVDTGSDPRRTLAGLIVGRTDLRPRLQRLDQSGRRVLVIIDACYSGNAVRSIGLSRDPLTRLPARSYPLAISGATVTDYFDQADAEIDGLAGGFDYGAIRADEPYPYQNLVFLSSANDRELATDIPSRSLTEHPTVDQRPHGAFTDALLRVLRGDLGADQDGNQVIDYLELRNSLTAYLERRGFRQTPQLLPTLDQDGKGLALRALLSSDAAAPDDDREREPAQRSLRVALLDIDAATRRRIGALPGIVIDDRQPDLIIALHDGLLRLLTPTYETIVDLPRSDHAALQRQLAQRRWFHGLFGDDAPASAPRLDLQLADGLRGGSLRDGERIFFHLRSARPSHILMFDLMSDGNIAVLYPWREQELQALGAGQVQRIPAKGMPELRVERPYGSDRVFALSSEQLPAFARRLLGRDTLDATLEAELRHWLQKHGAAIGRASVTLHTGPRR